MKLVNRYIFLLSIILGMISCQNEGASEQLDWSNSRLLDIPAKIRMQQFKRGNLLVNPSFEDRKAIRFDSLNVTYNIAGWKKEGKNIQYIDLINNVNAGKSLVYKGSASFMIQRNRSNEYEEEGEGIYSDFIKVLPGMYDLYVHVKGENLKPYQTRLSQQLMDAVDIRILYFDKNKLPLTGAQKHPFIGKNINISFKGLGFNNFLQIDSTRNWLKVKCVSGYYPFNEGVIPDLAKFVKIYIGLKGTGTLLVDNVEFFYSKENLTPRERSKVYFDSLVNPIDLLVPKPQKVSFIDTVNYFNPDAGYFLEPYILTSDEISNESIQPIKKKLLGIYSGSKFQYDIRTIKSGKVLPAKYERDALVISIGNTSLYRKYSSQLINPENIASKRDGYIIDYLKDSLDMIFIFANSDRGYFYAGNTLSQLFDGFKYYASKITDFPYYENRAILIQDENISSIIVEKLKQYRINECFIEDPSINDPFISVYPLLSMKKSINGATSKKLALFTDLTSDSINARNVLSIIEQHKQSIKRMADAKVYLNPPFNNNTDIAKSSQLAQLYFQEVLGNNNTNYLWNGHTNQSKFIDDLDAFYINTTFSGTFVYMDNYQRAKVPSINLNPYYTQYPEKIPMGCIYDPFDPMKLVYKGDEIFMNIEYADVFSHLRMATFGEFAWNPANFDPDLSLYKILVKEFGFEHVKYFYFFNDAYCGLLSTIHTMEKEGNSNRTTKSAENEIVMLNVSFEKIKKHVDRQSDLIDLLYIMKRIVINKYNNAYEKVIINKKIKEDSALTFLTNP